VVSPADRGGTAPTVESEGHQFMAIPRGYRFNIMFDNAFPQGLVLILDPPVKFAV
jgi:hypothetical protein